MQKKIFKVIKVREIQNIIKLKTIYYQGELEKELIVTRKGVLKNGKRWLNFQFKKNTFFSLTSQFWKFYSNKLYFLVGRFKIFIYFSKTALLPDFRKIKSFSELSNELSV